MNIVVCFWCYSMPISAHLNLAVVESHPSRDMSESYCHPLFMLRMPKWRDFLWKVRLPADAESSVMDAYEHAHQPWVRILSQMFCHAANSLEPSTKVTRQHILAQLDKFRWSNDEENFLQAREHCSRLFALPFVDASIVSILNTVSIATVTAHWNQIDASGSGRSSAIFVTMCLALKHFILNQRQRVIDEYNLASQSDLFSPNVIASLRQYMDRIESINESKLSNPASDGEIISCLFPITTECPDQHTTTQIWTELKGILQQQHSDDMAGFKLILIDLMQQCSAPLSSIADDAEINRFIRFCRCSRTVSTGAFAPELDAWFQSFTDASTDDVPVDQLNAIGSMIRELVEDDQFDDNKVQRRENFLQQNPDAPAPPSPADIAWYCMIRAAESVQSVRLGSLSSLPSIEQRDASWPGWSATLPQPDDIYEQHCTLVQRTAIKWLLANGVPRDVIESLQLDDCAREVVRYSGREVHNVSAFIGGIGAQISLKLLLKQYVPLNNTFVFNGIHCSGAKVKI